MGEIAVVYAAPPLVLVKGARLPPHIKVPQSLDLLVFPFPRDGYPTRLFFSDKVEGPTKPNWNGQFHYAERLWHAYSFNCVPASLRLAQIVSAHLQGLG